MKERLLELLTKLGYSATRLADEISVQRSGISHILSGRNQPSFEFLVKLLKRFPDISAEWLLLGKGSMLQTNIQANAPPHKKAHNTPKTEGDLFNDPTFNEAPETITKIIDKVTDVNNVTRIILLNSDGSFEVYHHSGNV